MRSKQELYFKPVVTIGLKRKTRGALRLAMAPGLAALLLLACHKTPPVGAEADGSTFASGAAPDTDAAAETDAAPVAEVAPPPAVVAEDPNIPLNEAAVGAATVPADYSAESAPPPPVVEDQPAQPAPDQTWVPGYWWWSPPLGRYVWVSGCWRVAPHDQSWTAGSWGLNNGRYYWTPGYWGPRGYVREMIGAPPPPLRSEVWGVSPGVGFVWTPGYYGWRGGVYEWMGGSWLRPPSPGYGWVAPRYVETGGRFFLQPGRWDVPPARRGVVYRPVINVSAGAHVNLSAVPQGVVTAHVNFLTAASHIQAQGGTRTANGGYSAHGSGGTTPSGGTPGGGHPSGGGQIEPGPEHGQRGSAGVPPGGQPPTGGQPTGGQPQRGEPHQQDHEHAEGHPAEGHPGNAEGHPGNAPHTNPVLTQHPIVVPHQGGPPPKKR